MSTSDSLKTIEKNVLSRFLKYVQIETTSSADSLESPSTACQWDLLKLLVQEMRETGISDASVDKNGYITASIPPSAGFENAAVIGFLAHADTSPDVSGKNVKPLVHDNYSGEKIILENTVLDSSETPALKKYIGETIITSDGTTLLGADDKAGIAEIMTAAEYLIKNPEIKHGKIEIFITPDEEIGRGMNNFPMEKVKSEFCYTLDGDGEGTVEYECFNAYSAALKITGKVIHLGSARGRLVNSVKAAADFISMLPASESPEATDGRYGYYCPHKITGTLEETVVEILLRDFDSKGIERRINTVKKAAEALESLYPGCRIELDLVKQYSNMIDYIGSSSRGLKLLYKAVKNAGADPVLKIIRGGTDGARMSEMGIPCPNIFTGGYNYHSRTEWASLPAMVKSVSVIISLAELWAQKESA